MAVRPAPQIHLLNNPWEDVLPHDRVLTLLGDASSTGEREIVRLAQAGELEDSGGMSAVFAQVYLDPTNPREQLTIRQRIMAIVLFGDPKLAETYVPYAAAKADKADRHGGGRTNGWLISYASFTMGKGDVAWGANAEYGGALSAGSGLLQGQDRVVSQLMLEDMMESVHAVHQGWLEQQRIANERHGWYNLANVPGPEYLNLVPDLAA